MKKIVLTICCYIVGISSAWACSYSTPHGRYEVKEGQVYYKHDFDSDATPVGGVDLASFVGTGAYSNDATDLEIKWDFTDYASDANHVYYQGKILERINPNKAVLLKQYFWSVSLVKGLENYRAYDHRVDGYLKDDEIVYYKGQLLEGANGQFFEWVPYPNRDKESSAYARDDQSIYLYGQKVAGDPKTALEIGHGYYLDAKHIYFRGEVLEGALPEAFEIQSYFILSNGHVYYRENPLALDANSVEELDTIYGEAYVQCGGGTHAGSLIKDHNNVYILYSSGELELQNGIDAESFRLIAHKGLGRGKWAADEYQLYQYDARNWRDAPIKLIPLKLKLKQTYQEVLKLDDRVSDTYYRDDYAIYRDLFIKEGAENLEETKGIDAQTFSTFATLWEAIVFRDKNLFYLRLLSGESKDFIEIANSTAKLVCLEKHHLCLLDGETLYYIFDNGSILQTKVDEKELQCIKGDYLYGGDLAIYSKSGVCFDGNNFYHKNGCRRAFSPKPYYLYEAYKLALSIAVTERQLEELRLHSLERVHVERKAFIE